MVRIIILILLLNGYLPIYGFTNELKILESTIETLGTDVKWSEGHKLCKSKNKRRFGLYYLNEDIIIMCQGNHKKDYKELIKTLKHEGWHAVQRKCNSNSTVLNSNQIKVGLKQQEIINLKNLYLPNTTPHNFKLEEEAFVVEKIPTDAWLRGVKNYCQLD